MQEWIACLHGQRLAEFRFRCRQLIGEQRDVANQIRIETCLLRRHRRVGVKDSTGRGHLSRRFRSVATSRRQSAKRVCETIVPQSLWVCLRLRLFQAKFTAAAIHPLGDVQLADIDAETRGFVGHLALLVERVLRLGLFARLPVVDDEFLVPHRLGTVAFECV